MSRFTQRLDYAGRRMKILNSQPVIYRRGDLESAPINASPIIAMAEEISPGYTPSLTRIEIQDWMIDTADIVLDDTAVLPQEADEIVILTPVTLVPTGEVFKAIAMGNDEPPYRFVTSNRVRLRLHTTRVSRGS